MAPVFGYWKCRGLAHHIRLLLTYVGQEFQDKVYERGQLATWLDEKFTLDLDFPNLPYYIDDEVRLTQSNAILRYLARKHNLEGKTEEERIRIDILQGQIEDLRIIFRDLCFNDNYEQLKVEYAKSLPERLQQLSAFLGERKFFAGENLTFVDFLAYQYLYHQKRFDPKVLNNHPNLHQFYDRFEALPRISEYVRNAPASFYPLHTDVTKFELALN